VKKYYLLLALGVACGSGSIPYDDDDDSGGPKAGQAGKGGHAGVANVSGGAGNASGGAGSGAISGSGAMSGSSGTSGQGAEMNGGSGGSSGGMRGGTGGGVSQGGDTNQAGAGEGGMSGESGAGNSEGGAPARGGSSGTTSTGGRGGGAGTGGISGGGGASGAGGAAGTGATAGHAGSGGATGGTAGSSGGLGGKTGIGGFVDNGGFGGVTDGSSLPVVELLVDGSSTMFEDGSYTQVFTSLVTDGVLASFEGKLDLGLTIFQGATTTSTSESDPSCALLTNVGFAGDNGGEVGKSLADVGNAYTVGTKYETPTDFGILSAVNRLINVTVSSTVEKYIVLVINGEPNTCKVKDPQCGQDASIAMVQEARDLGIHTLVVGLGTILGTMDDGCEPSLSRCHADHLQDLANAGAGFPVEPPSKYSYVQSCVQSNGGSLVGSYTTPAGGGSAHYYASTNPDDLTGEFTQAFQAIVDATVP
jgi:hypothetical protein